MRRLPVVQTPQYFFASKPPEVATPLHLVTTHESGYGTILTIQKRLMVRLYWRITTTRADLTFSALYSCVRNSPEGAMEPLNKPIKQATMRHAPNAGKVHEWVPPGHADGDVHEAARIAWWTR
jgi:hypothetical protein